MMNLQEEILMNNFTFDLQTFAGTPIKLAQMVNPQVMADMISANLPKAIKFTNIATIDTTLQGIAGDTITIPSFKYIGDAKDVAEGAVIDTSLLETTTKQATVKKIANAAEITDEAILSGYGDPIGELVRQLGMSLASKVEEDVINALDGATLSITSANQIDYAGIVDGVDKFIEESDVPKVLFIHPKQLATIRKSADFIDKNKYGGELMMSGAIGTICGCEIVVSRRVKESGGNFTNYMVQMGANSGEGSPTLPAVTIYLKRDVFVETDRDILKDTTVVKANQHFVASLTNPGRVLKMVFKA